MAILKQGINAPFSGRVGNIVGYELNGQNMIRSLPRKVKKKPTAPALINRQRMAAVSTFKNAIDYHIDTGNLSDSVYVGCV